MAHTGLTPDYDLARRALVYRRFLPADPDRFPPRRRHGSRNDPTLAITLHRPRVTVEVEHHYSSGHAWLVDPDRQPVLAGVEPAEPALGVLLGAREVAGIRALLEDPERWAAPVLAGLFEPRRGAEPDRASPDEADCWELGRSQRGDGKLPYLTLRLTCRGREIVLDHSFSGYPRLRRLEPVHVPAGDTDIVRCFGEPVLAAARWLESRRLG